MMCSDKLKNLKMILWIVHLILCILCTYVIGAPVDDVDGICMTETCKNIGSVIADNINDKKNPCDGFFEYACGGWVDKNPVPKFSGEWSRFAQVQNETINLLREILENRLDNDTESIRKAQNMYKLCMDTDRIEQRGIDPLLWILRNNDNWPIIMNEWNKTDLSWIDIHEKYIQLAGHSSIFTVDVKKDPHNSESRILSMTMTDPPLIISSLREKNLVSSRRRAVSSYLHSTVIELQKMINSTRSALSTIVSIMNMMAFENSILLVSLRKNSENLKIMTVKNIQKNWNELIDNHPHLAVDWISVFNLRTADSNIIVNENNRVSIYPPTLINDLVEVLKNNSLETTVNYIHWTFVKRYMKHTNAKMYSIANDFKKELYSFTESPPRWRFCVFQNRFQHIISAEFLNRYVDKNIRYKAKNLAEKIIIKLINKIGISFNSVNGRVGQDPTDVLHNMKYNIGYPDWYLNLTHVNTVDEKFNLQFDYFESYLAYNKYQMKRTFGLLSDTTDGNIYLSEWSSESILNANAYYDIHQNLMILPVGLLRFPFFHIDLPPVFVYSQVGVILAHEMSHAFTSRNSKEQFFIDDSQCFYKQYEKYEIIKNSINEPIYINENETLDENVADNLGLDLSYDLYKQMKKEGKIKELKIPGLQDFTDDQLFFLGFANTFCGDETRKHLLNPLAKTDHPPYKWRVNGAISNTKGFSKAFSCPPDAPMNPVNKCSIWR